jgi:2-polyprenyl-3-methyl-5-hydroxy-6-metoxy-1,4-benzoquinol methylase
MMKSQDAAVAADLDALMARVRDTIARRTGDAPPRVAAPASLDGFVSRQSELNNHIARAIASLSTQISALKDTCNALSSRPAPAAPAVDHPPAASASELERAVRAIRKTERALASLTAKLTQKDARRAAADRQRSARLTRLEQKLDQLAAACALLAPVSDTAGVALGRADAALAHFAVIEEKTVARLDEMRMRVLRAERASRPMLPAAPAAEADTQGTPAFDYFMFEHRFRGTGDDIRRRQAHYLERFAGRQHVLDVGCGRGEFLHVALTHGIGVTGVDASADMVAFCRDAGLPATHADLFDHLAGLPDCSLDGLFCAQVIEHLTPDDILRFVHLAAAKLRPGSPIVIETVNPHCPAALGNFFLDPTHVRPVPPLMLRFVLEQSLFAVNALRFTGAVAGHTGAESVDGLDPLPADASAYQDYAALAVRS